MGFARLTILLFYNRHHDQHFYVRERNLLSGLQLLRESHAIETEFLLPTRHLQDKHHPRPLFSSAQTIQSEPSSDTMCGGLVTRRKSGHVTHCLPGPNQRALPAHEGVRLDQERRTQASSFSAVQPAHPMPHRCSQTNLKQAAGHCMNSLLQVASRIERTGYNRSCVSSKYI